MKKVTKKEIRKSIADAMKKVHLRFKASVAGKKGEKLLDSFSKKYATEIKKSIKKTATESAKEGETQNRKVPSKKIK